MAAYSRRSIAIPRGRWFGAIPARPAFAKNGDDAARKAAWRELPTKVRLTVTRWAERGDWSGPDWVADGAALPAYLQGNGRAWRDWLASAKAWRIAGAVDPEEVVALVWICPPT